MYGRWGLPWDIAGRTGGNAAIAYALYRAGLVRIRLGRTYRYAFVVL